MKRIGVCIAVFFLVAANASLFAGGKSDGGLASEQQKYPESDYISAIGTGRDRTSAESNAKLALSQILGESISAEQVTTQYSDSKGREEATISSVVNEKALFDRIAGIVIKGTHTDKKTGTTYALAVLDRKEAGNYYYNKVNDANTQVSSLLSKANASKGKIESLDYLASAVEIATENKYDMDLLSVINPTQARMAKMSYQTPQTVSSKRTELASALRVWIRVTGSTATSDQLSRVRAAFAAALTDRGVAVVAETDATATHSLVAELLFSPADSPDPSYHFVRYTLGATLAEFATSKEVPYSLSGREGHVTESQAKNRAVIKIEMDIKENYLDTL